MLAIAAEINTTCSILWSAERKARAFPSESRAASVLEPPAFNTRVQPTNMRRYQIKSTERKICSAKAKLYIHAPVLWHHLRQTGVFVFE